MTRAVDDPILSVEHLSMRFGGIVAVGDLSFVAQRGHITALIGPNGAGKTTVFNCITGFYRPTVGMIRLRHADGKTFLLERLLDFRIARHAKVARTFQNVRLFAAMTVLENLMVAQHAPLMLASGFTVLGLLGLPAYRRAERTAIDKARNWIDRIAHKVSLCSLSGSTVISKLPRQSTSSEQPGRRTVVEVYSPIRAGPRRVSPGCRRSRE